MKCPRCSNQTLMNETYEGVTLDRCLSCLGTWLDDGELIEIIETEEKEFGISLTKETLQKSFSGIPESEKQDDLACPKCNKQMRALNYVYSSGVIVDRCPDNHGVWLDVEELEKVQIYKEQWSKKTAERKEELDKVIENIESEHNKKLEQLDEEIASQYLFGSAIKKVLGLFD